MPREQLRKVHQAQPFRPFVVRVADGREYPVRHPEFLSISPSGRSIIVADTEETFEVIDLMLVTSLSYSNGKSHRSGRK